MSLKRHKPAFQSVELDPIDQRLEAKAVEKGIPTLVSPKPEPVDPVPIAETVLAASKLQRKPAKTTDAGVPTPRDRMMTVNIEVPAYVWIAIKTRAAQVLESIRHFTLKAYRAQGIQIRDEDMIEDGRRLRGSKARPAPHNE